MRQSRFIVLVLGLAAALVVAGLAVVLVPAWIPRERAVPPATPPTPATPIVPSSGQDPGQPGFLRKLHEASGRSDDARS